jgi:mRNA interferase RelE/StbE
VALRVRLLDAAVRDLARLDKSEGQRVVKRIDWLAANYGAVKPEALSGRLVGFHKLRVGDLRVIYEVLHSEHVLLVHVIGHRRDVYRAR